MSFKVNIFELTRQIFGINGYQIAIGSKEQPVTIDNNQIEVFETAESIGQSIFDTPIFETIAIKHPLNSVLTYFEDAPMIEVGLRKMIVKSVVTNRPGTVKEFTNVDDYQIKVKGVLVNHLGEGPPHDKIEALKNILYPSVALEVESKLLQSLDVFNIVVIDFKFIPSSNYTNVVPFEFSCISDNPIELNVQEVKHTAQFG